MPLPCSTIQIHELFVREAKVLVGIETRSSLFTFWAHPRSFLSYFTMEIDLDAYSRLEKHKYIVCKLRSPHSDYTSIDYRMIEWNQSNSVWHRYTKTFQIHLLCKNWHFWVLTYFLLYLVSLMISSFHLGKSGEIFKMLPSVLVWLQLFSFYQRGFCDTHLHFKCHHEMLGFTQDWPCTVQCTCT